MIPLTIRSNYSFMWGVNSPEEICSTAARLGYKRLALTDTDNLCGLWPFLSACKRHGITPIVGAEVTDVKTLKRAVCLVENETGYQNLCRLISRRHMDEEFNLASAVIKYEAGLVVLTQDEMLLTAWHEANISVAGAMPRRPMSQQHPLCKAAKKRGVPMVATPGSFFLSLDEAPLHRLLRAISKNTSLSRLPVGELAPVDAWLAGPEEYARRFDVYPEALLATEALAEKLSFTRPRFGIVLPPWNDQEGKDAVERLRIDAYKGARWRYGNDLSEGVVDRLEHELRIIEDMGFSSYFLIVRDIVSQSPRICGRGSGAASLVAYCLGITNVCPMKHNLYFERFLNPGRTDPPDIDVDFAWDERDQVLKNVLTQFEGHVAMVSNHVCFQPRMAVREVAKVYGLTDAEIGRVSKRLPRFWKMKEANEDLLQELKRRPDTRHINLPEPWPEILTLARRIVGNPRYLSVHSGGVVITPNPIDTYAPIQKAPKGVPILQWEKDAVEAAGLVKIDLLGNRSLGVIRDAIANLKNNGKKLDEQKWEPEDDAATQASVAKGHTMGCFYIESPATRLLQEKAGKGDFEHLVIHSSIIRPAANDYIQLYLQRLHGAPWDPIHPLLSDVLEETFGIMVYQEDVSRVATALAGFSASEADHLRKILSKKDRAHVLKDYYEKFRTGAVARGVSLEQVNAIWQMIMSFDGYSFCKPHSASYARVSFQAAYLKTHYPAEFMAAVISNHGGFYSPFAYVSEARRWGVTVMPPDVNQSRVRWTGREKRMRVGLLSIKGLSIATRERIVNNRSGVLYKSLTDFLSRVDPHEDVARQLLSCGALDSFSPQGSRAQLMWAISKWQATRKVKASNRLLFEDTVEEAPMPLLPPDDVVERLRQEFSVLGFLCDRHPMTLYENVLKRRNTIKAASLRRHIGRRITLAGWLITGKKVRTKHGEAMEFLTFEDETGLVETTFFPKVYDRFCYLLDWGRPYLLFGEVDENFGAVTLTVERVAPIGGS
jgi:DNA-directed DNA polymerase III PolC